MKYVLFTEDGYDELLDKIMSIEKKVNRLTSTSDNVTYGIKNGVLEIIADPGEVVLVDNEDTAVSLALDSLAAGQLVLHQDSDNKMVEEVKELLGEDLFNELAAQSVQTMELAPQLTDEQKLKNAKAEYYRIKEMNAAQIKAMQEAEASSIGLDVEQNKAE